MFTIFTEGINQVRNRDILGLIATRGVAPLVAKIEKIESLVWELPLGMNLELINILTHLITLKAT